MPRALQPRYSIRANWNLVTENGIEVYHSAPTQRSYLTDLGKTRMALGIRSARPPVTDTISQRSCRDVSIPAPGAGRSRNGFSPPGVKQGRAPEIDCDLHNLVRRHGRAAKRIRGEPELFILPNLVINTSGSDGAQPITRLRRTYMQIIHGLWLPSERAKGWQVFAFTFPLSSSVQAASPRRMTPRRWKHWPARFCEFSGRA